MTIPLATRGNADLLGHRFTALLCSQDPPPDLILPALDLARAFRRSGVPVISGFHSALEREALAILLPGTQPVAVCLARPVARMRLPPAWRAPLEAGRLLLLASAAAEGRRTTAEEAEQRNRVVCEVAERVVILHARPGGRLHRLAKEVIARRKPLLCLEHPSNGDLLLLGARPVSPLH